MNRTAESTLPKLEEIRHKNEIWKYDEYLNTLIDQRKQTTRNSVEFKNVTKQIKCRVKYLNNEKCSKEAASINEYITEPIHPSFHPLPHRHRHSHRTVIS